MSGRLVVLRLGHRPERDKRITTHVCLTARALGADEVILAEEDKRIVAGVEDVTARFGGPFTMTSPASYRKVLKDFKGTKVHLTMYGLPMEDVLPQLSPDEDLLVVVGAEKVPRDVYDLVDHNVAVGNQPHSEVAALALFLYGARGPATLQKRFEDGQVTVVPTARGKRMAPPGAASEADEDGEDSGEDASGSPP